MTFRSEFLVHCRAYNINRHYHHLIHDCLNIACQRHFRSVCCKDKSVHGKFLDLHEQRFDEQFPLHSHLMIVTCFCILHICVLLLILVRILRVYCFELYLQC